MRIPEMTHREFHLIAPLISGAEKTPAEIMEEAGWETTRENFFQCGSKCHRLGFIDKVKALRRSSDGQLRNEMVYRVTERGRQAWMETVEWHVFIARQFGQSVSGAPRPEIVAEHRIKPQSGQPSPDRLPTPAEERKLLAEASPEFRIAYQILRRLDVTYRQLFRLRVEDVDLEAGTIRIADLPPRPLDNELRNLCAAAIGERTAGPLLLSESGVPWDEATLGCAFRTLRRKAGLPRVTLRGRRKPPAKAQAGRP